MIQATLNAWKAVLATGPAFSASIVAIAAVALWHAPAHAQRATYDQQRSYYDPGVADPGVGPLDFSPASYDASIQTTSSIYVPSQAVDSVDSYVVYVGNYGSAGTVATQDSESATFSRISDHINSDAVPGAVLRVQDGPNGGQIVSTLTDFGDLHTFNVGFDTIGVARQSGTRTFDDGGVYWIFEEGGVRPDPDRVAADHAQVAIKSLPIESPQVRRGTGSRTLFVTLPSRSRFVPDYSKSALGRRGTGVGLHYGYRNFGQFNSFRIDAEGGILGRTYSDTRINNWVTGPQAGIVAYKTFGPLHFYGHALGVAGLNDGEMQQNNGIITELVPGVVNRLLYAQSSFTQNSDAIVDVSPTGVLWAEAGLQVTERTSVRFAWSAMYVNNILLAEDRVRYFLPDMGFRDPGEQDYLEQFFFCGVEVVR